MTAEEQRRMEDLEQAFEYAVKRYWQHYDTYGPFWRLFRILAVVVESLDDQGKVKSYALLDFPRYVQEARRQLVDYVEWQKEQEDMVDTREEPLDVFLLIDDEVKKLREAA